MERKKKMFFKQPWMHDFGHIFWKNLLNKPGVGWFTNRAPGFLSRFHWILLKKAGAGRFTERAPGFLSRFFILTLQPKDLEKKVFVVFNYLARYLLPDYQDCKAYWTKLRRFCHCAPLPEWWFLPYFLFPDTTPSRIVVNGQH